MLYRVILMMAFVAGLQICFGCEKKDAETSVPAVSSAQEAKVAEVKTVAFENKSVSCPICGESTSVLYICIRSGCEFAKRAGCSQHFRSSYVGWRCTNGHTAKKVWPRKK